MSKHLVLMLVITLLSCAKPSLKTHGGTVLELTPVTTNYTEEELTTSIDVLTKRFNYYSKNCMVTKSDNGITVTLIGDESEAFEVREQLMQRGDFMIMGAYSNEELFNVMFNSDFKVDKKNGSNNNSSDLLDASISQLKDKPLKDSILSVTKNFYHTPISNPTSWINANIGYAQAKDTVEVIKALKQKLANSVIAQNISFSWSNEDSDGFHTLYALKRQSVSKGMNSSMVKSAELRDDEHGGFFLTVSFKEQNITTFSKLTRENINKNLAVLSDKKVLMIANVREEIPSGVIFVSAGRDKKSAKALTAITNSGILPLAVKITKEYNVKAK